MASSAYGIDLGTCNIKIYSKGDDSIMTQKNIIAIENKNFLFSYGDPAFDMYEKAPSNIHISYPLCNGVIADIKNMQTLIKCFITDLCKGNVKPADYVIAVPTDVTEVEKRAFYDLVKNANVKAKKVMVVEKAIADGLGMDIDVKNSQGVLVVNIGFDTTEISILSLGGIVLSKSIKFGGNKLDEAIIELTEETTLTGKKVDGIVQYFYSLIAMGCMFGCFIGLQVSKYLNANIEEVGIRRAIRSDWKCSLTEFLFHTYKS